MTIEQTPTDMAPSNKDLRAFLRLFDFNEKKELVRYCRNLIVTQEALVEAAMGS